METAQKFCEELRVNALIDDAFRLGKKEEDNNRPMLIKFVRTIDRKKLFLATSKLKGKKIFVNEDISKEEVEYKKTLRAYYKERKKEDKELKARIRKDSMRILKIGKVIDVYKLVGGQVIAARSNE